MAPLPSPEALTGADVVLYDGGCVFCRAGMERLARWDRGGGGLGFLSIHDPAVAAEYPDCPRERLLEEMCVIDPAGTRHWGADAMRRIAVRLPSLWWLRWLFAIPGAMLVARPVYRLVARNRYLIAGKREECADGACSLHR
ncbi:MAG: thiol-disulfide oxidoreductase DCC family protein [Lacipirellulaceae bacterium]